VGTVGRQVVDAVDHAAQHEGLGLEHHPFGLDLRQVQDVVDQREQVLRGLFDLAQLVAQAGRLGRLQARPARPITPASGVRSSWLMLARKRLWLAGGLGRRLGLRQWGALLHQLFQVFAVPAQFLLGIVPGRDVLHHAHHPCGRTLVVAFAHAPPVFHPQVVAVAQRSRYTAS
jgi:hypothetical protein